MPFSYHSIFFVNIRFEIWADSSVGTRGKDKLDNIYKWGRLPTILIAIFVAQNVWLITFIFKAIYITKILVLMIK